MNLIILPTLFCGFVSFFFKQEIPMNFVDPKEYDIPGLVRKNRYKTILPSKFLLFKSLR